MKKHIDNEQYKRLFLFYDHVKKLVQQNIAKALLDGVDRRSLFVATKSAVPSGETLYKYSSKTIECLFNDALLDKNACNSRRPFTNLSIEKFVVRDTLFPHQNFFTILINKTQSFLKNRL